MKRFLEKWFGVRTKQQAEVISRRLSIAYGIIGWNCFALLFYSIMRDKVPEDPEERRASYKRLTGAPPSLQVYQVHGLRNVNKFTVTHSDEIYEEGKETD